MDAHLEEAARSLGARGWAVARDVWWPQLMPTTMACSAIVFATAIGAFGTAFTLSSKFEVLPISIYNEFTNYANFALAASLSISLGLMTWLVLCSPTLCRAECIGGLTMHRTSQKMPPLMWAVHWSSPPCAGPMLLSILAGVVVSTARASPAASRRAGCRSLTGYGNTVLIILFIACACVVLALVRSVCLCPGAQPLAWARHFEELLTLPVAIPGLASAALLLAYGSVTHFRQSFAFILVGHVIFTLPFMVRMVGSAFRRQELVSLEKRHVRWGRPSASALYSHSSRASSHRCRVPHGFHLVGRRIQPDAGCCTPPAPCPWGWQTAMPPYAWRLARPTPSFF
jgi:ABC-type Fe3+ transport system permease subunit